MTEAHECDGCIAVIIPTYNERENIHPITERVLSTIPEADLFIIDDNSPDGTGKIADELAAADERIHVVHRRGKEGLATAYLGSRWVPGGAALNWPRSRAILSRAGNSYARVMLGIPLHDMTGGYRVYRASALREMGLENIESVGYCFQIDLARRAVLAGLKVAEVPITFVERTRGASKMSGAVVSEALWRVTQWGIMGRLQRYRGVR